MLLLPALAVICCRGASPLALPGEADVAAAADKPDAGRDEQDPAPDGDVDSSAEEGAEHEADELDEPAGEVEPEAGHEPDAELLLEAEPEQRLELQAEPTPETDPEQEAWTPTGPGSRGLCNEHGWCWENPRPWGSELFAIWGTDAEHIWAAGRGRGMLFWDGADWHEQLLDNGEYFGPVFAIWGADASHVWAVGGHGLWFWDGARWTPQHRDSWVSFSAVWGVAQDQVWAVGTNRMTSQTEVWFFDGQTWQVQQRAPCGSGYYQAGLWGADREHIWVVGEGGCVLFFDGTSWTEQHTGFDADLTCIWGTDATHVWAAGGYWRILFFDGKRWTSQLDDADQPDGQPTLHFRHLWGLDERRVWASASPSWNGPGLDTGPYAWNGEQWTRQAVAGDWLVNALWGLDPEQVWAVTRRGVVLTLERGALRAASDDWSGDLYGVWGSDAERVWTVGDNGRLLQRDVDGWQ
ncbi:MAG: hypothetical protein ABIO70_10675, partial [Pseudomonadota bacterium]